MIRRVMAAMLLTAGTVLAQPAAPAAPAAAPAAPAAPAAVVPVNQETPRGSLKMLSSAMEDGDGATIKKVMATTNPSEEKMVTAMASLAESISNVRKASVKSFGKDGAKDFSNDPAAHDEAMRKIDGATEAINGDTATVNVDTKAGPPVNMKKIDGKWVVPMSEVAKNIDPAQVDERVAGVTIQANALNEAAKETEQGKYKTPDELKQAIEGKMMKAALQHASATSQPAGGAAAPAAPNAAPAPSPAAAPNAAPAK
jgi:hypothetical protein